MSAGYELAMFPLESPVVPGQPVPLHIFEPRYRQLAADLQDRDDPEFGIVGIERGREVGGADVRTDLPRYRVFREGVLTDEPTDISDIWSDDLITFLIGCSFIARSCPPRYTSCPASAPESDCRPTPERASPAC